MCLSHKKAKALSRLSPAPCWGAGAGGGTDLQAHPSPMSPMSRSVQLRRVSVVWGSNTFVGFCSLGFFSMHGLTEVKPRRLGLALRHQWLVHSTSPAECPWRKAALAGQEMHNQVWLGRSSELTHVGQRRRVDQGRECRGIVYRLLL